MKIKLQEIIDGMEMQFEGTNTFLCSRTGEVVSVSEDDLRTAEEIEEVEIKKLKDWQQDNIRVAIDVVENFEDYEELPTQYDINEYEMMEDFSYSIKDNRKIDILLDAIRGRGAFRRFKDKVNELGISEDWYQYRSECYKQKAIEWCNDNGFDYVE
ncbi:Uncharacterised protein family (UPF0158) [Fontibacillus panacisegetis]|uniref:Uncharacterized protein family (UPF0158) n=1 Tax=Fontibacillus panacisegetis TaxID=670482 RepID=A0A1G7ETI9_9BACL|nr:UPF0158 family protein [Fontibacillus panacisegetis]SDE66806.1 Uncharacterised protein family (UPF0158) [Fontibacillus panacisegetis]